MSKVLAVTVLTTLLVLAVAVPVFADQTCDGLATCGGVEKKYPDVHPNCPTPEVPGACACTGTPAVWKCGACYDPDA